MRDLPRLLISLQLLLPSVACGQELLPPPKAVTPAAVPAPVIVRAILPPPAAYYRVSAYEHWQHLAPAFNGQMVPRVIASPYGYYYSATGKPYYWATVQPTYINGEGAMPAR
jgi:hypothetical protein